MTACRALFLAGLLGLAGRPAAAECLVSARLEPAAGFVGQPVLQRTVTVRPAEADFRWTVARRYPGFRVERLEARTTTRRVRGPAGPALHTEERIWLFPVRAGTLTLPAAGIRCGEEEAVLRAAVFEARPPPTAGRPEGFTGVVGTATVSIRVAPEARLGESIPLHVTLQGRADLSLARVELPLDAARVEVFPRPPRLTFQGTQALRTVRSQRFDLVPREAGALRIPALRIPFFDPETGRYAVAESEPAEVRVHGGAAAGEAEARSESLAGNAPRRAPSPPPSPSPGIGLGTAAAILSMLGVVALLLVVRAVRARRTRDETLHTLRAALREADRAANPEARLAALERAARTVVEASRPGFRRAGDGQGTQGALEAFPDATPAACERALASLERARFAGDAHAVDADAIRALFRRRG